MYKILVVEDDNELQKLFVHVLGKSGYEVMGAADGSEAVLALRESYFDLIISDIMMPEMDGYQFVETIRQTGVKTPVLIITAKDAYDDMKKGYLVGADDYMIKPVNVKEMLLKVQALIRRSQMMNERIEKIGETVLECDSLTVTSGGVSQILPQKEFMLLYKMVSYPGKIFTRQQLMDDIWGYEGETDTHTVDVHIGRLREKFRDNKDFSIVTIRGLGYKIMKQ